MAGFLEIRRRRAVFREAKARALESEIVKVLVKNFDSIERIYVFGSLAEDRFRRHSDIDVAVEGVPDEVFIRALCVLNDISDDFEFDLVELDHISPLLRKRILEKGVPVYDRKGSIEKVHK